MGRIFQNRDNIPSLSLTPGAARSVIRWARDIANALEFIHSQGIVHRDFKLENIMVSTKNGTRIISYFRVAYDKKTAQTFTNSAITFILHLTRTTAGLAEKRNTCSFLVSLKSLLLLSFVMCIISQLSHEDDVRVANVSVSRGAKMTTGTMKETFYIAPEQMPQHVVKGDHALPGHFSTNLNSDNLKRISLGSELKYSLL